MIKKKVIQKNPESVKKRDLNQNNLIIKHKAW